MKSYSLHVYLVKAYIHCHANELQLHEDPIMALLEATACITTDKAHSWFKNAGYIVD